MFREDQFRRNDWIYLRCVAVAHPDSYATLHWDETRKRYVIVAIGTEAHCRTLEEFGKVFSMKEVLDDATGTR